VRSIFWLHTFLQDLRYAARGLTKTPGFVAIVVLSLALGIGANATIFSVMNALLYRPLSYDPHQRLVAIWETPIGHPDQLQPPPIAELLDWHPQNSLFDDIALTSDGGGPPSVINGPSGQEYVRLLDVTPNYFSLLGVKPLLGRVFTADEMREFTETVVISNSFWTTHYHSDPSAIGKTFIIRTTGILCTIVGVMPPGVGDLYGEPVGFWQPINAASPRYSARQDHWLMQVGRLKPGVTLAQAQAEVDVIAQRLAQQHPETNKGIGKKVQPLHDAIFGFAKGPLYPLFGTVIFVLLIACANVANLLQSRTETRRSEYAVRASLGASRSRLVQQLFAESSLLALTGGLLGVLLSFWGINIFRSLAGNFAGSSIIRVDFRVVLFTLGISLFTAFLFGLFPAVQACNPDLNATLREGSRRTSTGSRGITRHAIAVCEIALAMVLLIAAGLMINSLLRVQRVNPGFDSSNLLAMRLQLPEGGSYMQRVPGGDMERAMPQIATFWQQLFERVAALPGVESVGSMLGLPGRPFGEEYSFSILGKAPPPVDQRPEAGYTECSPSIFETLKIPLKRGRYLDVHDSAAAPWAVVVNETFAHRFFPDEDPIGRQILLRYDPYPVDEDRPRTIVGVVADIKQRGLGRDAPPYMYASIFQQPTVFPGGSIIGLLHQDLAIRPASGMRAEDLSLAVKKIVTDLDAEQPVQQVTTMNEILDRTTGDYQFFMKILGAFAGFAVLLAVLGIYGVMSYYVNQRTREIGIRVALGADSARVVGLVVRLALKLALLGVFSGALLALGATRLIGSFLYDVKPSDPLTYSAVALTLIAVALLAAFLPARRATRVDPLTALRYE
jgi:putative ABC transport system permease protein